MRRPLRAALVLAIIEYTLHPAVAFWDLPLHLQSPPAVSAWTSGSCRSATTWDARRSTPFSAETMSSSDSSSSSSSSSRSRSYLSSMSDSSSSSDCSIESTIESTTPLDGGGGGGGAEVQKSQLEQEKAPSDFTLSEIAHGVPDR